LRIAVALIALESLGLLAAALIVVIKAATETSHSLAGALLLAAVALCGVAMLALCARGLLRLSPASRTPVLVIEVLAVPVAWDLFSSGKDYYGGPILVAALAVLYLLFTPPVRAVLDRPDPVTRR
jgi:hypothetical protein